MTIVIKHKGLFQIVSLLFALVPVVETQDEDETVNVINETDPRYNSFLAISNLIEASLDYSRQKPCDNFYKYACGNHTGQKMMEKIETENEQKLRNAFMNREFTLVPETQAQTFFKTCMEEYEPEPPKDPNEEKLEKVKEILKITNLKWIEPEDHYVVNRKISQEQLTDAVGLLYKLFGCGLIKIEIKPKQDVSNESETTNELVVPKPKFLYRPHDQQGEQMALENNVKAMIKQLDDLPDWFDYPLEESTTDNAFYFEARLLDCSEFVKIEIRKNSSYEKIEYVTLAEAQNEWNFLNWTQFLTHYSLEICSLELLEQIYDGTLKIRVEDSDSLYGLTRCLQLKPQLNDVLINYLMVRAIGKQFEDSYRLWSTGTESQQKVVAAPGTETEKIKACLGHLERGLPMVMDKIFLEETFPDKMGAVELKKAVEKFPRHLREGLRTMIDELKFLKEPKKKIYAQLDDMVDRLVAPEMLITNFDQADYAKYHESLDLQQGDSLQEMLEKLEKFAKRKHCNSLTYKGKDNRTEPFDYYDRTSIYKAQPLYEFDENVINVPAGFLQPPLFDSSYPLSVKFGMAGFIISSSLSKALTGAYLKAVEGDRWFMLMSRCLRQQFEKLCENATESNRSCIPDIEEIISNSIGLHGAWRSYQMAVGFEGPDPQLLGDASQGFTHDQLFFLAFANVHCSAAPKEITSNMSNFNPEELKVIGILQNSYEFSNSYNCKSGEEFMAPAPSKKCRIFMSEGD